MKDVKEALNSAYKDLKLPEPRKVTKYSIVDFCTDYLQLPVVESVEVSKVLLHEMPVVYIQEENWGDTLQNGIVNKASQYGNRIRRNLQNKVGVGATGNKPTVKQSWANPIAKIGHGVQDFFNTKGSALRNSPMIRVDDNAKGITKYIAFPDLDLSRPGHKRVLDSIIQGMAKDGKTAQQINVAAPERAAAQQAGNYAEITSPDASENKKEAVEAALQQLEDLITRNKDAVSNYSFMSAEELDALQKEIATAAGQASQTISQAQQSTQADAAQMGNQAEKAAEAPAGASPAAAQNQGGITGAHAERMGNIVQGFELQQQQKAAQTAQQVPGQQPGEAITPEVMPPAPGQAPQAPKPDDNIIDVEAEPTQPGQMPALGMIQQNANDLAGAAKAKMSAPVNAQAAADSGKTFEATPAPAANFSFGQQPTASAPAAPGMGLQPQASTNAQLNPATPESPAPAGLTAGPAAAQSVPPKGLQAQLINQSTGTIDDTIANHNASLQGQTPPAAPEPFTPANPSDLPDVDQEALGQTPTEKPSELPTDDEEDNAPLRPKLEGKGYTDPLSVLFG